MRGGSKEVTVQEVCWKSNELWLIQSTGQSMGGQESRVAGQRHPVESRDPVVGGHELGAGAGSGETGRRFSFLLFWEDGVQFSF